VTLACEPRRTLRGRRIAVNGMGMGHRDLL
jgi:hypothetical protein